MRQACGAQEMVSHTSAAYSFFEWWRLMQEID